jgi:hypothetical protein
VTRRTDLTSPSGTETALLVASAGFAAASAVIGFRWVASPYFKGYSSAAAACFLLSRVVAHRRQSKTR